MSEKSFKESLRNKATKLLAGLSLFSHTAYGQPEAKNDEPEKEKTENVSTSPQKETSLKDKDFVFGQDTIDNEGKQEIYYSVNDKRFNADTFAVQDLAALQKKYRGDQKEAYAGDKDAYRKKARRRIFSQLRKENPNKPNKELSSEARKMQKKEMQKGGLVFKEVRDQFLPYNGIFYNNTKEVEIIIPKLGRDIEETVELLKERMSYSDEASYYKFAKYYHDYKKGERNSPGVIGTIVHEFQHKNNDRHNLYAPGLSIEQYGKLYQYDEMSASLAGALAVNRLYEAKLAAGISPEEALEVFSTASIAPAYVKEVKNGLNPASEKAKELLVKATISFWADTSQKLYEDATIKTMKDLTNRGNVGSLAIGDDKELKKRVNAMFDNLAENEVLKLMHVAPGKLSQYLPEKGVELSPPVKEHADNLTKETTGLSITEAKEISQRLPGSQKKDIANLMKILTGRKEAPKAMTPSANQQKRTNSATSEQQKLAQMQRLSSGNSY